MSEPPSTSRPTVGALFEAARVSAALARASARLPSSSARYDKACAARNRDACNQLGHRMLKSDNAGDRPRGVAALQRGCDLQDWAACEDAAEVLDADRVLTPTHASSLMVHDADTDGESLESEAATARWPEYADWLAAQRKSYEAATR